MILVSFSSTEDALSNDVNKYDINSSQGTENLPFRFFGGTPGIALHTFSIHFPKIFNSIKALYLWILSGLLWVKMKVKYNAVRWSHGFVCCGF